MTEASTGFLADGLLSTTVEPAPGDVVALAASACVACGRHEFPARDHCPTCRLAMAPVALSPSPRVAGYTAVNHPPPGASIGTPYVVAIGAFTEGISVMGVVHGAGIDEITMGDALETVAVDIGGRIGFGFRLASGRR